MYVDEFNISAAGQFFGVETTENEKKYPRQRLEEEKTQRHCSKTIQESFKQFRFVFFAF